MNVPACVSITHLFLMGKTLSKRCALCFSMNIVRLGFSPISSGKGALAAENTLPSAWQSKTRCVLAYIIDCSCLGW